MFLFDKTNDVSFMTQQQREARKLKKYIYVPATLKSALVPLHLTKTNGTRTLIFVVMPANVPRAPFQRLWLVRF